MTRRRTHQLAIAGILCLLAALAACSTSSSKPAPDPPSTDRPVTSTTTEPPAVTDPTPATDPGSYAKPPCTNTAALAEVPATTPVDADGNATLTSFDGTRLRIHWFPLPVQAAGAQAPTVLMGPGWSLPGDTDTGRTDPNGGLLSVYGVNIPTLREQGYNVLTWDPRGFGESGGTVEVDEVDHEGKDVQRLLSWVAAQPGVQLDAKGDPRVGMVGGSYGGAIQLVTAAIDCRVDAIVPQIAWSSLVISLYKAKTVKSGWAGILYNIAAGRQLDPHLKASCEAGTSTGGCRPTTCSSTRPAASAN